MFSITIKTLFLNPPLYIPKGLEKSDHHFIRTHPSRGGARALTQFKDFRLVVTSTAANGNERLQLAPLLQRIKSQIPNTGSNQPIILEGDRGYDAKSLRIELLTQSIYPLIPYRKMKGDQPIRLTLTSFRCKMERSFSWLKGRYRRFLCRFEKTTEAWESILDWMLIHY